MKDLNGQKLANSTQVTVTAIDLDKQILTVADAQNTYQLSANNGMLLNLGGNFLKKASLKPSKIFIYCATLLRNERKF